MVLNLRMALQQAFIESGIAIPTDMESTEMQEMPKEDSRRSQGGVGCESQFNGNKLMNNVDM